MLEHLKFIGIGLLLLGALFAAGTFTPNALMALVLLAGIILTCWVVGSEVHEIWCSFKNRHR